MISFDQQVSNNLNGIELENNGNVNEAIQLYEENINSNFIGSHPYNRLAIIYRKRHQTNDEIRVLGKAIYMFENIVNKKRGDRYPKLEKFKSRLNKILGG